MMQFSTCMISEPAGSLEVAGAGALSIIAVSRYPTQPVNSAARKGVGIASLWKGSKISNCP